MQSTPRCLSTVLIEKDKNQSKKTIENLSLGENVLEMPLGARLLTIGTQRSCLNKPDHDKNEDVRLSLEIKYDSNQKATVRKKIRLVRTVSYPGCLNKPPKSLLFTTCVNNSSYISVFDEGIA